MAVVISYPAGIQSSATGAHATVTSTPVYTDRTTYYVDSTHPNASDTNPGTEEEAPFASLAGTNGDGGTDGAYFTAAANNIIIVGAGHVEPSTCSIDITKAGLSILGCGSGTTRPILKAPNVLGADTYVFNLHAAGVEVRNFILRAKGVGTDTTAYPPASIVRINGAGCVLGECDIAAGPLPTSTTVAATGEYGNCIALVTVNATTTSTGFKMENCDLRNDCASGAYGASVNPLYGIYYVESMGSTYIESCTFDGGADGFDKGAIAIASAKALTNLRVYNCTFDNGADIIPIGAAYFRGILSNNTMAASCRIVNDRLRGYPLGLVAATDGGNAILSNPNLYLSGNVYWLDNSNALASDTNAGSERDRPLATLAQAISNFTAANGDLIVVESGHAQALLTTQTISEADTKVFGLGTSSAQKPSFTISAASLVSTLFTLSGNGVELHGLRFPVSPITCTRVSITGEQVVIEGCDFTSNTAYDLTSVVINSGDGVEIDNCTFTISAAPALVSSSSQAITSAHTAALYNLIRNCTFDGGSSALGWSGGALALNSAVQRTVILGCTFLNGSDLVVPTGETNVTVSGNVMDATSRVEWTS